MAEHRYHRRVDLADANDTVAFAASAVVPGSRVLDVGAADGSVASVLVAAGCEVVGIEPDPSAAAPHSVASIWSIVWVRRRRGRFPRFWNRGELLTSREPEIAIGLVFEEEQT